MVPDTIGLVTPAPACL